MRGPRAAATAHNADAEAGHETVHFGGVGVRLHRITRTPFDDLGQPLVRDTGNAAGPVVREPADVRLHRGGARGERERHAVAAADGDQQLDDVHPDWPRTPVPLQLTTPLERQRAMHGVRDGLGKPVKL